MCLSGERGWPWAQLHALGGPWPRWACASSRRLLPHAELSSRRGLLRVPRCSRARAAGQHGPAGVGGSDLTCPAVTSGQRASEEQRPEGHADHPDPVLLGPLLELGGARGRARWGARVPQTVLHHQTPGSPTGGRPLLCSVSAQVVPGGRTLPVLQSPALPNLWATGGVAGGVDRPWPQRSGLGI